MEQVEEHMKKKFDSIEYCKNYDFYNNYPEVLVWSNDPSAKVNGMLGTQEDFILTKIQNKIKISINKFK